MKVGDLREPLTDEQIIAGRTWDVQLALALLDATAGTGLGGKFLPLSNVVHIELIHFENPTQLVSIYWSFPRLLLWRR